MSGLDLGRCPNWGQEVEQREEVGAHPPPAHPQDLVLRVPPSVHTSI